MNWESRTDIYTPLCVTQILMRSGRIAQGAQFGAL